MTLKLCYRCEYSGIPHLRKCILRKRDTEIFEKVSIYKKVLSLNKLHFLLHSLILIKFITGTTNTGKVLLYKKLVQIHLKKTGFLNAGSRCRGCLNAME